MRFSLWGCGLAALLIVIAGCARYPSSVTDTNLPPVVLYTEITVKGRIDPNYFYFFAVDTDGDDGTGPVPVVSGNTGTGWGTIDNVGQSGTIRIPPFYVVCNGGAFQMYRVENEVPVALGRPFTAEIVDQSKIVLEIDARDLVPDSAPLPATLQVNWITMQDTVIHPQDSGFIKEYDGFGTYGNEYLYNVRLDGTYATHYPGDNFGTPEELPGDTTATDNIDLIGWNVGVLVRTQVTSQ